MDTTKNRYLFPASVIDALKMASSNGTCYKYIAGGTDLIINIKQGNKCADCLIDLSGIKELKEITRGKEYLKIGSLLTLESLANNKFVSDEFPLLAEAANSVASPLIRKTATIGGNLLCENRCLYYNQDEWWREAAGYCLKCEGDICIASGGKNACFSEAVSDTAPALISMGAKIEVADSDGVRILDLDTIYTGDGIKPINLNPSAIITSILLPRNQEFRSVFKKLRQRESLEFTSLTSAISINKNNQIRISLSGVDPKPVLVEGKAGDDISALIKQAIKSSRAINNEMMTRKYRRAMIRVFLNQSFEELDIS